MGSTMPKSPVSNAWGARGAVPKALEPGEVRPTSDHSATGLNSATDLDGLRHTLNAYEEIAWFIELDYAPLAPQALETGDFGIVEPIL